ncbi:MAG: ABC transporter permease [Actinobacteria bacterium]|nr:ABC transporter permease [Actinomycetota bacterium]
MSRASRIPVSTGLWRGVIEFKQDFAPTRLPGQLLWPIATLAAMYFFRNHNVGGVLLGSMMYPSVLGMFTIFGMQLMVQYLAADREDGTLLRARSTPGGVAAYLIGKVTLCSLTLLAYLAIIAIPGAFLVHGLAPLNPGRALTLLWVLALGMAASQALGAVVGSMVPTVRAAGYVSLLLMSLIAISGIFYPVTALPGWLQIIGQTSPIYWVGHGMRAALLPDAYATVELGGTWRLPLTALALAVWALIGAALAPRLLRAMTRKESGTRLSQRQHLALERQI